MILKSFSNWSYLSLLYKGRQYNTCIRDYVYEYSYIHVHRVLNTVSSNKHKNYTVQANESLTILGYELVYVISYCVSRKRKRLRHIPQLVFISKNWFQEMKEDNSEKFVIVTYSNALSSEGL